jgi:hypothetical protein
MITIKQVDVECIDVFWDDVRDWIQKAADQSNGRHTIISTYRLLKENKMTLFVVLKNQILKAAYVVQRVVYPNLNTLCILFCGGSEILKNMKQLETFFCQYAKENNCARLEIIGRKGWIKAIKKDKLKLQHTGYFYEMVT